MRLIGSLTALHTCIAKLTTPDHHYVFVLQAWSDLTAGTGYSSEVGMQLADMSNYLITKGLGHLQKPMWWLNGLIDEVPEGGQTSVDQAVGMGIMQEMRALQEHIYFGRMDDEQSVVESLLDMSQSVRRWNPRILALDGNADAEAQKVGCETGSWCVSD